MVKRGQVTLFIIIGLVLLLSIGIVVYVTTTRVVRPIEEKIEVPADVKPVHDFITDCLFNTGKQGVQLLGLQGGYIYIPAIIAKTPAANINLDPTGTFKIPFWYYEGEDRTPSIKFMQSELTRYVKENLPACIDDFSAFEAQYDISSKGDLSPKPLITDSDVLIRMKWPLEVSSAGKKTAVQDYVVTLPVKLKESWELADKTMKAENKGLMFENLTIDLLTANENTPTDGMEFTCSPKKWKLDDVRNTMQRMLFYNLPNVRIRNTAHTSFLGSEREYKKAVKAHEDIMESLTEGTEVEIPTDLPSDTFERFRMFFDVGMPSTDLRANFDYQPQWGIQLAAQPQDGGYLKSNMGRGAQKYLGFVCINQWHFTYDIIYPVRMTIKDNSAFNGEGFSFQFGFPVLINDNTPERVYYGIKKFESTDYAEDFCENYGSKSLDVRVKGILPGYPISTELPDVKITYSCIDQFCELGETKADEGYYRLRTMLPQGCAGAFIKAEKEGYLAQTKQITGPELQIDLPKLKKLGIDVVVHEYNSLAGIYGEERDLGKNEKVHISLVMVNDTFERYTSYPSEELGETIELVEGNYKYDLDLQLILLNESVGGYHAEDLEINYADFAGADKIILHVFEFRPHDETKMFTYLFEGAYEDALRPTFQ